MRNKRTLQRGLALLLAGGMALSNLGAVPVLAEEYDAAPETVQATPETAAEKVPDGALSEAEAPLPEADLAEGSPAAETTAAPEIAVLADESAVAAVMAKAAPAEPDVKVGASIDFADVAGLNDDLNGWTYSNGGGTTELVADAEMGQVLKMSRTSDGGETALIYDGLSITESDTRYVTVTAEMKLDKDGYAHQYSIPYIFDNSGAVAYSLFTNDSAAKYQSHVNGKNTTDAGTLTTDTWQTVRMDIDMQSDTFRVSVDGVMSLSNAKARTATDNLQKIKFYADSWNRGTLYIKSVSVTASNTDPFAPHTTAATYYVSPNGDDSKDGKTEQTAWKTIARVNQDTYIPGDKILFERGGEWENTTLQPQGSGSADAHITIGAYGDETKHKNTRQRSASYTGFTGHNSDLSRCFLQPHTTTPLALTFREKTEPHSAQYSLLLKAQVF